MMSGKKKEIYIFVALLVFVIGMFTGCGSSKSGSSAGSMNSAAQIARGSTETSAKAPDSVNPSGVNGSEAKAADKQIQNADASQLQAAAADPSSKIIRNGTVDMETKDFMNTVNKVMNKAAELGGYVESSNITGMSINNQGAFQNRTADVKLRIPQKYFTQFMTDAGKIGNVIRSSTSSENVTYQYYDTEAHVKALTTEEDRLLELLKKTGELKDVIEIEKELASVRYQIENLTGTLKKLDNLVDYSTVEVIVSEVQEIQEGKKAPITMWDKISMSFTGSIKFMVSIFKGILIGMAYAVPFIIIAVPIIFIIKRFGLIKRFRRKEKDEGNK